MNNYFKVWISIFVRNLENNVDIPFFVPNIKVIQLKIWKSDNSVVNNVLTNDNILEIIISVIY